MLGTILGLLAKHGCDKLTVITSRGLAAFGAWREQLLAQSTGKEGKKAGAGPPVVHHLRHMWIMRALAERGRRLLRVHVGADVQVGLATLTSAME